MLPYSLVAVSYTHLVCIRDRLTREEKREYLDSVTGVSLGSDAFFPFGDNIERAAKSGVSYVAQPGGSVRDDNVIAACDRFGMTMCFTCLLYTSNGLYQE